MRDRLLRALPLLTALLLMCVCCAAEESDETELTAKGYVLVTAGSEARWFELPESEDYTFSIRQTDAYGGEMNNTITLTPDGVYMQESDCENQDCVGEGLVTLENKSERVLGNMIVCLPHQIMIELYSLDEVLAMTAEEDAQ